MSEKKDLKQMRLPFQSILVSPKAASPSSSSSSSKEDKNQSPHTPKTSSSSRKRKPSSDGDNFRSTKIGRTNSKENIIAEQDPIEIVESDTEDKQSKDESAIETTPNKTAEKIVHIKLPSSTKRKREREEKQKLRLMEKEMREEAKRKEREEKEEQRRREKEDRDKKRQAELDKKEEERRQKEEEKRMKEEEKRLKEEERRQKEEERRQKEDERKRQNEAREEERKKKEMEKVKEEERKKRAAEAFTKFFVPKKKTDAPMQDDDVSKDSAESAETTNGKSNFMPFQIRGKMRLAPCVRLEISKSQLDKLDEFLKQNNENESYLKDLKNGKVSKSFGKTWPEEDKEEDDDVIAIDELEGVGEDIKEDEAHLKMKHRAKLLLFHENRRPAYHGTWRKKSANICARRPFATDSKFFDYEVDSDEEWEEEEPGESLHGSDSEKEKDVEEEDYEVDNDFFVPHGHLSEEEMQQNDDEIDDNSPEAQKAKLKILQQEFAAEMKKKTEKIKPRLIGCIWMNGDEDEDGGSMMNDLEIKYHCSDIIWRILKAREMMSSGEEIKMEDFQPEIIEADEDVLEKSIIQAKTPAQQKVRPKITNDSVKELIRLIHGNLNSKKYLIREFQAYRLKNLHNQSDFQEYSVKSVDEKVLEISDYKSCPEEGPLFGKKCWLVKPDIIKEYFGEEKLILPNQWTYILEKKVKEKKPKQGGNNNNNNNNNNDDDVDGSMKNSRETSPEDECQKVNETGEMSLASKEFQKQTISRDSPKASARSSLFKDSPKNSTQISSSNKPKESLKIQSSTQNSGKKRVALLMSVQRGQSINEEKKNHLISQYLKDNKKEEIKTQVNDDGVIEIID